MHFEWGTEGPTNLLDTVCLITNLVKQVHLTTVIDSWQQPTPWSRILGKLPVTLRSRHSSSG
jgi:hypothetical protein